MFNTISIDISPESSLQEAGSRVHEVLLNEFSLGVFPMVLYCYRGMWIFSVPYFWITSLEANVYLHTTLLILKAWSLNAHLFFYAWILQVLLQFQHDLCGNRDDLFPPCELVFASWSCALLGAYVAANQTP